MGTASSLPVSIQSHGDLYQASAQVRAHADRLLDYSIHELTVQDFMKLSDPSHCKQYVMMMANHISHHFYELRIQPGVDRSGVLFFREAKDLTTGVKSPEKEVKDMLCIQLAYFYVRIFQVYGALALSLVDDIREMNSARQMLQPLTTGATAQTGLQPRGIRPYLTYTGGALSTTTVKSLGVFEWLRPFLHNEIATPSRGYRTLYSTVDVYVLVDPNTIYGVQGKRKDQGSRLASTLDYYLGKIYLRLKTQSPELHFLVSETRTNTTVSASVRFIKLVYLANGKERELSHYDEKTKEDFHELLPESRSQFEVRRMGDSEPYEYHVVGQNKQIAPYMNDWLTEFIPRLRDFVGTGHGISEEDEKESGQTRGVPPALDAAPLLKLLKDKTKRPRGHCVARALQLLRENPLSSAICKVRWGEGSTKEWLNQLPEPGRSLRDHPGMASTSVLFYDLISNSGLAMSPMAMEEHRQWMKVLSQLFSSPVKESLKDLQNQRDQAVCDAIQRSGQLIPLSPEVASQVADVVRQLFQRQWEHVQACDEILKELFVVETVSSGDHARAYRIGLHPVLLKEGIVAVNRINQKARRLLGNYYVHCETLYSKGLEMVARSVPHSGGGDRRATQKRIASSSRRTQRQCNKQ